MCVEGELPDHHAVIEQVVQDHRRAGQSFCQGGGSAVAAEHIEGRDDDEVHPAISCE